MRQKKIHGESPLISTRHLVTESIGGDTSTDVADGAAPISLTITDKNGAFSAVETRLTQEMRVLIDALQRFSCVAQSIGEELPDTAQFGKSVIGLLSLLSLQFSYSLLKDIDTPFLLGGGSEHLQELGLSLSDAFREIDLDGRKFLAVALIDKCSSKGANG